MPQALRQEGARLPPYRHLASRSPGKISRLKRSRTRHLKTLSTDTTRDPRRFDAEQVDDAHWDAKSDRDEPRWVRVDVGFVEQFKNPVSLATLKADPKLEGMLVIKKGMRLSVQPVTEAHFFHVCALAGSKRTSDGG
jgi:predicted RNA-binding protein with PUA-like domain